MPNFVAAKIRLYKHFRYSRQERDVLMVEKLTMFDERCVGGHLIWFARGGALGHARMRDWRQPPAGTVSGRGRRAQAVVGRRFISEKSC